jgi:hypothetical protein
MQSRGRALRFTAVSTLVVLTLTGFSTGRHGHHSGGGGGGGGCSSSHQDHDTSSSTSGGGISKDDDNDGYGGSGSYRDSYDGNSYAASYDDSYDDGSGGDTGYDSTEPAQQDATAELVSCATERRPYATVDVTNPNDGDGRFVVTITFQDAGGDAIVSRSERVDVSAHETVRTRVDLGSQKGRAGTVAHCNLDPAAPADS